MRSTSTRADRFHARRQTRQKRSARPPPADLKTALQSGRQPGCRRAPESTGGILGDDHNLEVLCEELSKDRALCDVERLRRAVNRNQRASARKAAAHTARIYGPVPDEHVRGVRRAWKVWQRGHKQRSRCVIADEGGATPAVSAAETDPGGW